MVFVSAQELFRIEGQNVINDLKGNKALNVIAFCPKYNKVLNVITFCPKCKKLLRVITLGLKCIEVMLTSMK